MSVKNVYTLLDKMFYSFSTHNLYNLSSHFHQNAKVVKMASGTNINPIRGAKRHINTYKTYKAIPIRRFRRSNRHYFELKETEVEPDLNKDVAKSYKHTEKSSPLYRSLYSYKKPQKHKYVDKKNTNQLKYFNDDNEVEQFTRRVTAFRTNRRSKDKVTWPPLYKYKGVDRKRAQPPIPKENNSVKKFFLKATKKIYPTEVLQPLYPTKTKPLEFRRALPKVAPKIKEIENKHEEIIEEDVEEITEKVTEEEINSLKMKIKLHKKSNTLDVINRMKYQLAKIANEKSSMVQQYLKNSLEKELSMLKTTSPNKYAALMNEEINKTDISLTKDVNKKEEKEPQLERLPPVEMLKNDRMSIMSGRHGLNLGRNKVLQKSNENIFSGTVPSRSFSINNCLSSNSKNPPENALVTVDKRNSDLMNEIDEEMIHKLCASGLTPRRVMKYVEEKNKHFKIIKKSLKAKDKKEEPEIVTGMTKFFTRPKTSSVSVTSFSAYKDRQRLVNSKIRQMKSKLKIYKEKQPKKPVLLIEGKVTNLPKEDPAVKNEQIEPLPQIESGEKTKLLESPAPLFTPPNRMLSTSSRHYNKLEAYRKPAYQPLYGYKKERITQKETGVNKYNKLPNRVAIEKLKNRTTSIIAAANEIPAKAAMLQETVTKTKQPPGMYLDMSFPQKVEPLSKGQRSVMSLRKLIQEKMGRMPPVVSKSATSVPNAMTAIQKVVNKSEPIRETSMPVISEKLDTFPRMTSPSTYDKDDAKIKLNIKKQESVQKFREIPKKTDTKTVVKNVFHTDIPEPWKNQIRKSVFPNEQEGKKQETDLQKNEFNKKPEINTSKESQKFDIKKVNASKPIVQDSPKLGVELSKSKNLVQDPKIGIELSKSKNFVQDPNISVELSKSKNLVQDSPKIGVELSKSKNLVQDSPKISGESSKSKNLVQDIPKIGVEISKRKNLVQDSPKVDVNELLSKSTKNPTSDLIATSKKLDALQKPENDPNIRNKVEVLSQNLISNNSISYPNEPKKEKTVKKELPDIRQVEQKLLQEIRSEVKKACERSLKEIKSEMTKACESLGAQMRKEIGYDVFDDKGLKNIELKPMIFDSRTMTKRSKSLDKCVNLLFEELYDISKKEVEHLSTHSLDRLSHKRYLNKFDDIMNKITQKIYRGKKEENDNEQKCDTTAKNKHPNVFDCREKDKRLKQNSNIKLEISSSNGGVTALNLSKDNILHATISLPSINASRAKNVPIKDEFKSKGLNKRVQCEEMRFNRAQCVPSIKIMTHKTNDSGKNKDVRGVFDISVLSNNLEMECPVETKCAKPKIENVCNRCDEKQKTKSKYDAKTLACVAPVPKIADLLLSDDKELPQPKDLNFEDKVLPSKCPKFEDKNVEVSKKFKDSNVAFKDLNFENSNFLGSNPTEITKKDVGTCTQLDLMNTVNAVKPKEVCIKAAFVFSKQKKDVSTCTHDSEKAPLSELINSCKKQEAPSDKRRDPLTKFRTESDVILKPKTDSKRKENKPKKPKYEEIPYYVPKQLESDSCPNVDNMADASCLNVANSTDNQPQAQPCMLSVPCDELQAVPPDNIHTLKIQNKKKICNNMTSPSKVDVGPVGSQMLYHVQQPVLKCFLVPDISELQSQCDRCLPSQECCPSCPQEECCQPCSENCSQCCPCSENVQCCQCSENVQCGQCSENVQCQCSENVQCREYKEKCEHKDIQSIKNQVSILHKKTKEMDNSEKCDLPLDPNPIPISIENYQEPVFDHKSIRITPETQEYPKRLKLPYIPIDYEKTWYTESSVKPSLKHDSKGKYYYKISGMLFPK